MSQMAHKIFFQKRDIPWAIKQKIKVTLSGSMGFEIRHFDSAMGYKM
jgi:hypothetical protein